jgi:hypothetical protein
MIRPDMTADERDDYLQWWRRVWRSALVLATKCVTCGDAVNITIQGVCVPCQYAAYADRPGPDCP